MVLFSKLIKPAAMVLFAGIILRLALLLICHSRIESFSDTIFSIALGLLFDLCFICTVFLALLILSKIIPLKVLNFFFYTILFIWVILNSLDLFSFNYLGARTGFNSFNLFRLNDIVTKFGDSGMKWWFISYLLVFTPIMLFFRKRFVPSFVNQTLKQDFLSGIVLFSCSMLYLPFPINYYTDQLKISKESKQIATNPYYSWLTSLMENSQPYPLEVNTALQNLNYSFTLDNPASLARNVQYKDSAYDNIILLVMESFGANRTGVLNGDKNLSPNFDSLCHQGKLYTKCFACGPRTQYGISSLVYGFPHILGYNLFRKNKLKLAFNGLPKLLEQNKYTSHFIHGGDANYDDMSLLLNSDMKMQIKDMSSVTSFKFKNLWGIDDESLFNYTSNYINQCKGKNFFVVLSMSNHEPHQLPNDYKTPASFKHLTPSEKAFLYSDYALGQFIKQLKNSGIFEKSLIIVTGDHGEWHSKRDEEVKLFHVPLLVIDHKTKNTKDSVICSHADVAEFILQKTGFNGRSHLLGSGLTPNSNHAVFYRNYGEDIYKVTDSVIYRYNLKTEHLYKLNLTPFLYVKSIRQLTNLSAENSSVTRDIKSYYTVTRFLFENGLYHTK